MHGVNNKVFGNGQWTTMDILVLFVFNKLGVNKTWV